MTIETIAVLSPGDMGHGVGQAIKEMGFRVITSLDGRGELSRERAASAGIEDVGSIESVVRDADLILSILPPEQAPTLGRAVADAMKATGLTKPFADCNAVSPDTVLEIAAMFEEVGATFIDGGIIGPPPHSGVPKIYVSGRDVSAIEVLDGDRMKVISMGPEVGHASGIKMCYASVTKGTLVLRTAALMVAENIGVGDALQAEFEKSQAGVWKSMTDVLPWYAMNSARYVGEMEEIAKTYASAGLSSGFHTGAADTYRILASTPLSEESREHRDLTRTLDEAIKVFANAALERKAAK
ncbi:MAG: DUF1932 domain-containing protein [Proteobacteria bacterium]|nr:DUF1932 domain-containing protein [Pseudomonadota bacterium]